MKKKMLTIASVLLAVCMTGCNKETKDERIKREATEFTQKNCPKEVDPYTTMDSTCFDPVTRVFSYHYTVKGNLDDKALYTEELKNIFRDKVLKEIKTSISMKAYKDAGLTFVYEYRSATSGEEMLRLEFPKEEYK